MKKNKSDKLFKRLLKDRPELVREAIETIGMLEDVKYVANRLLKGTGLRKIS